MRVFQEKSLFFARTKAAVGLFGLLTFVRCTCAHTRARSRTTALSRAAAGPSLVQPITKTTAGSTLVIYHLDIKHKPQTPLPRHKYYFSFWSSGEKPYVCTIPGCDKRFTEYSSLYKHQVVHMPCKPYKCSHCGRTYKQISTLAQHKRTAHNDSEPIEQEHEDYEPPTGQRLAKF